MGGATPNLLPNTGFHLHEEISKDHAGKYRFHIKAPNGEIIAASQGYETKANAEKGIQAIKTHAPGAKWRITPASREPRPCVRS